jgi:uncharacterized membrane protein
VILFLAAPIYFLFQSAVTLLLLQTLALGLSAYPLYLIARKELPEDLSLVLLISYLLYPCLGYVNLFEFHPTVFATLFIALTLYYMHENRFGMYFLFVLFTLLCQENTPLVIIPLGIYLLIIKRPFKWWFYTIIAGVAWFWFAEYILIPHFGKGTIKFIYIYGYLGDSLLGVLKNILGHPMMIFNIVFTKLNLIYLNHILGPVLFLPILSPLNFLGAIPTLLQHLISMRGTEHTIYFHYTAEMIPFVFFASIFALKKILLSKKFRIRKDFLAPCLLITMIGANVILGPQTHVASYLKVLKMEDSDYAKEAILKKIPPGAPVAATFEFLPKLANRKHLYSLHHVVMGTYTLSDIPYRLPDDTEYVLADFWDWLTFRSSFYDETSAGRLRRLFNDRGFNVVDMTETLALLKKGAEKKYELYRVLEAGAKLPKGPSMDINDDIRLIGYDIDKSEPDKRIVSFQFYWKCLKETNRVYTAYLDIFDKEGRLVKEDPRFICYRVYPTNEWKRGEIIEEFYRLLLPAALAGQKYEVRIRVE